MSTIKLEIDISGHCSYVSEPNMDEHIRTIAKDIKNYSERLIHEEWYRKIQIDYEEQESVDLTIAVKIIED